jgi:hypothetical protein
VDVIVPDSDEDTARGDTDLPDEECRPDEIRLEDALPLSLADEVPPYPAAHFGWVAASVGGARDPRAWVLATGDDTEERAGFYVLRASDWAAPVLPDGIVPRLSADPWGTWREDLEATSVTTDEGADSTGFILHSKQPEGSTWFATYIFDQVPSSPTSWMSSDAVIDCYPWCEALTDGEEAAAVGDLDADGLDDVWMTANEGYTTPQVGAYLAPYAAYAGPDDADFADAWPTPEEGGFIDGGYAPVLDDLDQDGYLDLFVGSWSDPRATTDSSRAIHGFFGPLLVDRDWSDGDVVLVQPMDSDAAEWEYFVFQGPGMLPSPGIQAVGDVTGDGRREIATWSSVRTTSDTFGRVWLLDMVEPGVYDPSAFPTRISDALSFIGPGDVNGDSTTDLVFTSSSGTYPDEAYIYVVPTPIPNGVDSHLADIASASGRMGPGDDFGITASFPVGDLDEDGRADFVFSAIGDGPSTVYLFRGCEEW